MIGWPSNDLMNDRKAPGGVETSVFRDTIFLESAVVGVLERKKLLISSPEVPGYLCIHTTCGIYSR